MQYGSSGEYIKREGEHEQIPESDEGDPSGEVQEGREVRSEKNEPLQEFVWADSASG